MMDGPRRMGRTARRLGRGARRGAVLLEAMVALLIMSTAGLAASAIVSSAAVAVRRAHTAGVEAAQASAFFEAVTLWTREDFDRRLGARPQGPWVLHIERPVPTLYVLRLTNVQTGVELLRTAAYRPEPSRASY